MSDLTLAEATENIYASIRDDNKDIEVHVAALKGAMERAGATEAVFETAKLAQSNRAGRKRMESYFAKKGIKVVFAASGA